MAQLSTVKLSRFDSQPWGFRLQGGKDFGQPLAIQKVNGNSLAEKAGLVAGDSLIRVNNVDLFNLSHKEAQNALVRAGNSFELTIQRGGSTWKPSVTPVGPTPSIQNTGNIQPVTKTSLAYKQAPAPAVGSQHNVSAKPFGGQPNGDVAKNLTNKVYNSPINIYSEENIAETLSAQTEVLAGGVLGVNFKKNEKTYNAANSEVLKMVQEIDNEPREPEPVAPPAPVSAPSTPKASSATISNPLSGLRHVSAPETKPDVPQDPLKILPPGQNICADCERLIVHAIGGRDSTPRPITPQASSHPPQSQSLAPSATGVTSDTPKCSDCERYIVGLFVRIKDKNLHVECFKCATCGQSLKNVGYYNINNKLYCDVHAKLVARQNPPAPNLDPITIPPGMKPSSVIGSALSSAPSSLPPFQPALQSPGVGPGSPLPGTLAPLPFHDSAAPAPAYAPVSAPTYAPAPVPSFTPAPASTYQAPKPNLGVTAPAPRPLSDVEGMHYQSYSTLSQSSYSQNVSFESSNTSRENQQTQQQSYSNRQTSQSSQKKMSICSQEVATLHMDTQNMVQQLSDILEGQERCSSPTPADEVVKRVVDSEVSKEEKLNEIEQRQGWRNYQSSDTQSLKIRETGLAFLRSHSTPVTELEELYKQQQEEIELELEEIKRLGIQKRMSVDRSQILEIEQKINESQNQILEKQEKQKEIEKKKVRFEEEEEFRRQSIQVQESELQNLRENVKRQEDEQRRKIEEHIRLQEESRKQEASRIADENSRRQEESRRVLEQIKKEEDKQICEEIRMCEESSRLQTQQSNQFLGVEHHRERARTPVADFEARERHDDMSKKTETIYHTYEHLVQEEEDDEEIEKAAYDSANRTARPTTPGRGVSPYPGSIPGAEVNLLLKNIQGIQFEFDLKKATGKPEPKVFKLPDLRNLGTTKPYAPQATPQMVDPAKTLYSNQAPEMNQPLPPTSFPSSMQVERGPVPVGDNRPVLTARSTDDPQTSHPISDQPSNIRTEAQLQEQQIKEQRKQVHQELFSNERFRKKQERLGAPEPRFERAKTPVAELEDEVRHHAATERTQHIYDSFDQLIQTAERPRSRIGQPVPENQSINEVEKALFFQNISGINYEFENISELTTLKHLPEQRKSLFVRDVEQRTQSPLTVGVNNFAKKPGPLWNPKSDPYQSQFVQALTTMPETNSSNKETYEESLYKRHQMEQQGPQKVGLASNLPRPTSLLEALTIASDRPYSPLPSLPSADNYQVSQPTPVEQPKPQPEEPSPVALQPVTAPPSAPSEPVFAEEPSAEAPKYDGSRRRSSGFPGVNVQRTPYQMLRGSMIQNAFTQELKSQETAISQFVTQSDSSSTLKRRDTVDAAFGLMPSSPQIAYAPPPPADKRAELIASQAKFGTAVDTKPEKPKLDSKALIKPMSMVEALTIAPDTGYSPFSESKKPQATLVQGGSAVALTKSLDVAEKVTAPLIPPSIEIKPNYQVKDLQLNKSTINKANVTGFIEETKAIATESGVIEGKGITGAYERKETERSSVIEVQETKAPPLKPTSGFPPVTKDLQQEFSSLKQSDSARTSSSQTQQVQQIGDVTKTTKRSVVEVAEHSRKEFTQVRVIGGVDPVSGLRRTSSENVARSSAAAESTFQSVTSSGLQKPTAIPSYQSLLSEKLPEPLPPAIQSGRVDAKDFTPRPRSAFGGNVSKPEPTSVPMAFRSRTPVPIPKIDYSQKVQLAPEVRSKHLPTYNQDQVYRSASPRPIPLPKVQGVPYSSCQQPQTSYLKTSEPSVYRSRSPVPVPQMVKTTESYQQPLPSWRVQPKTEKRVSWPPKEGTIIPPPSPIPSVTSQTNVKSIVSQQEEKAQRNIEEARRSSMSNANKSIDSSLLLINNAAICSVNAAIVNKSQIINRAETTTTDQEFNPDVDVTRRGSVKAMINAQEEQAKKNEMEARRSSNAQSVVSTTPNPAKTSLVGKNAYPTPKHDPIIAPRPFGTPTPQRKIATPHFQPITPVAITEGSQSQITAPKLTFSTTQAGQSSLERKTSLTLTKSSASAFKPLDVVPIKPVPCKPGQIPISTPATSTIPKNSIAPDSNPDVGGPGAGKGATFAGATAPRRGRGVLNPPNAQRVPLCAQCNGQVRGPFITALGKIWCPDHFICATGQCRRPLADIGFVEEQGQLYCEFCFEKYIAPNCDKCSQKIRGDCLNAIGKHFHPECFVCAYCGKLFGNSAFFLEDGLPYCENDWNELFTTKCFACGFPIEAGDRWVEALNNNYHSQCFNCTTCKKNLEGQSFFAKGGRPFCKAHAR